MRDAQEFQQVIEIIAKSVSSEHDAWMLAVDRTNKEKWTTVEVGRLQAAAVLVSLGKAGFKVVKIQ